KLLLPRPLGRGQDRRNSQGFSPIIQDNVAKVTEQSYCPFSRWLKPTAIENQRQKGSSQRRYLLYGASLRGGNRNLFVSTNHMPTWPAYRKAGNPLVIT